MNEVESGYIDSCINEMVSSGVIQISKEEEGQFLSSIFTVPKPDGSRRFVLNLKLLNNFILVDHFKMEDIRTALALVTPNCYFTVVDQKDAYYMIPMHKSSRKFLKFRWKSILYEYLCLPFGLSLAPWLYTKVLKPVLAYLRSRLIVNVSYLDDLLTVGETYAECQRATQITISLLKFLGLSINDEKSRLIPCQRVKFLGFLIDSESMEISLPDKKKTRVLEKCQGVINMSSVPLQNLAELIGTLISSCPGVEYGQVYTRKLEMEKIDGLFISNQNYNHKVTISDEGVADLNWWIKNISHSRKKIRQEAYFLTLTTDASLTGWGATTARRSTRGHWNFNEAKRHINELELLAIYNALLALVDFTDKSVLIRSDSTTAISYINKYGGCRSYQCQELAKIIWQWCEKRRIIIFASYISTKDNIVADSLSRLDIDSYDFKLGDKYFYNICNKLGSPVIDLFASNKTNQCARFVSWFPCPDAEWVDAFTKPWGEFFFAFPPFKLLTRVLKKIREEHCQGIVVAPNWPNQPWFPLFHNLKISKIIIMKPANDLLFCPYSNRSHPLSFKTTLMAALLSANHLKY